MVKVPAHAEGEYHAFESVLGRFACFRAVFRELAPHMVRLKHHPQRRLMLPSDQIDADRLRLSRLRIGAGFKADGLADCDVVAFPQCRYMKENIVAPCVRFDEAEPAILFEHSDFTDWHCLSSVSIGVIVMGLRRHSRRRLSGLALEATTLQSSPGATDLGSAHGLTGKDLGLDRVPYPLRHLR